MKPIFLILMICKSVIFYSQTVQIKYYYNSETTTSTDTIINTNKLKNRSDFNWFTHTLKYSNGISLYTNDDYSKHLGKSFDIIDSVSVDLLRVYSTVIDEDYIKMRTSVIYKNYKGKTYTLKHPFYNQVFTIQDSFLNYDYKVTNQTKQILNYTCKKAIVKIGNYKYYYWFTDELGVTINPYRFESVPGVVLEIQGVGMHYLAYDIKVSDETTQILKPEFPKPYYNFKEAENKMKSLISN